MTGILRQLFGGVKKQAPMYPRPAHAFGPVSDGASAGCALNTVAGQALGHVVDRPGSCCNGMREMRLLTLGEDRWQANLT